MSEATGQELADEDAALEVLATQVPAATDPRELLASANGASGPARNAWLAFLGLLAYLLVTLAGVTHVDLLLNSPVTLPIVNVKIPLFSFFLAAPFLFVLVHLGLLVQHAMLAHKYQHFSAAIGAGDHPDRQLVHNYVFSQMLAGPIPPWPLQMLMRLMVFVTLSLLPVLVLLYFQIKFLPYHDVTITHAHRIAILLDLALLFIVRPYIAMPYLRPQGKKLRFGNESWRWEISYTSLALAGSLSLGVVLFSLLVATVPQACFWPFGKQTDECFSLDGTMPQWSTIEVKSGVLTREVFAPTKWLFEGKLDRTTGAPESLFSRNLVVTDKDLVEKKGFEEGETSLPLRGRDLRFAVLDRSDLHRADLFGADLRGISATETRLDYAEFERARMQGASLFGAQMQGADLSRAQMQGADLALAQMQGADLSFAQMQGVDLVLARMQGANLKGAQMQGADLSKARIWQTAPPEADSLKLALPMERKYIALLSLDEKSWLEKLITEANDETQRERLERQIGPLLLDSLSAQSWKSSPDHQAWSDFLSLPRPDPVDRSNNLAELACSDGSGGYIIKGIARRISRSMVLVERAHTKFTAEKLINKETCPAANHLSEVMLADLKKLAAPEQTEAEPTPVE